LKEFLPASASTSDAQLARDSCEKFCANSASCWGCSVACGASAYFEPHPDLASFAEFDHSDNGYWGDGTGNSHNNKCSIKYDGVLKTACAKKCLDFGKCLGFAVYGGSRSLPGSRSGLFGQYCIIWKKKTAAALKDIGCKWTADRVVGAYTRQNKGALEAFPLRMSPQICGAGGLGDKYLGNPTKEKECNRLSRTPKECQLDPTCTFHGKCTVNIPLHDPKLLKLFPAMRGKSFTCSCDQDIQTTQIQQFWGAFLDSQGPQIETCRAKAAINSGRKLFQFAKFCRNLHRRRDCLASPWCVDADATVAEREKVAKAFVDALIKCADKKCSKCQENDMELMDMELVEKRNRGIAMELEDLALGMLNATGGAVDLDLSDQYGGGSEC